MSEELGGGLLNGVSKKQLTVDYKVIFCERAGNEVLVSDGKIHRHRDTREDDEYNVKLYREAMNEQSKV